MIIALLPRNKFRGGHNSQTGPKENWESSAKLRKTCYVLSWVGLPGSTKLTKFCRLAGLQACRLVTLEKEEVFLVRRPGQKKNLNKPARQSSQSVCSDNQGKKERKGIQSRAAIPNSYYVQCYSTCIYGWVGYWYYLSHYLVDTWIDTWVQHSNCLRKFSTTRYPRLAGRHSPFRYCAIAATQLRSCRKKQVLSSPLDRRLIRLAEREKARAI